MIVKWKQYYLPLYDGAYWPALAALLFLAHKSTGPNKNSYCKSLGSCLGNFFKAPELNMKYQQLSSSYRKKTLG